MASGDRIELRGLRLLAAVGVSDGERARRQPVEVDLDLGLDLAPAGAADDLAATVDYAAVLDAVAAVVTGSEHRLLEALAEAVAAAVLRDRRVDDVTVSLRKLQPPVPYDLAGAGVRLTRRRA
ncbi:MAG TPA: dihydroneopterin aldolase [Acidimicrobiales bacterium]|nr:dihydroneopterin aldolase [Acidimicrobiales bacterium]